MTSPITENITYFEAPFPHFCVPKILGKDITDPVLNWLKDAAPWKLKVTNFYEQHEFSLLAADLGEGIRRLIEPGFTSCLLQLMRESFTVRGEFTITEVAAHKLVPGQTIRIHNDFIDGEETHRLLIQLNDGWTKSNGGLLMFFNSGSPTDVSRIFNPVHGSGLGFKISPSSFHAVSKIKHGERFTLVYSFKETAGYGRENL